MIVRNLLIATIFTAATLGSFGDAKAGCLSIAGANCDSLDAGAVLQPISPVVPISMPKFSPLQVIPFQNESGWNYYFSVGTRSGITAFETPFFGGWSPLENSSLTGYTVELVTNAGSPDATVRWTSQDTASSWNGVQLSFTSQFAPTTARINVTGADRPYPDVFLFMPLTPAAEAAGYLPYADAVPEPESFTLLIAGLSVLAMVLTKRRQSR